MRILMLTQWFNPEPNFKGLLFAKELTRRGHEVEVLTGFPNYPGGKLYDGYRVQFLLKESIDGIPILRVPLYPSHDSSAIKRICNYGSFAVAAATIGTMLVKPADVIYVLHPPATVGLPAIIISLLRKVPFVYDIQDLWPDTLGATGMLNSKAALSLVGVWCRFIYQHASKIVVLSPGFKKALIQRGVPSEKIDVIYNWCEEGLLTSSVQKDRFAKELGLNNTFNILFAGTMGKAQSLEAVLDAAGLVAERYPKIQFVFIGGGIEVPRLKSKVQKEHLGNVKFLPKKPVSEIGAILQFANVLLVHLKKDPLFRITIPSKIQAYMAVGKPILMGVEGDAARLVEKAEAGIICSSEDPKSIAKAAIRFYTMPREELEKVGMNGKRFYERELSISAGVDRFDLLLNKIIKNGKY